MKPKKIAFLAVAVVILIVASIATFQYLREPNGGGSRASGEGLTESQCKAKKGIMVDAGCSFSGECYSKCALPYRDGGKRCASSDQCDGACLSDGGRVGHCQEYDRLPNCSYLKELLEDGSTRPIGSCDIG